MNNKQKYYLGQLQMQQLVLSLIFAILLFPISVVAQPAPATTEAEADIVDTGTEINVKNADIAAIIRIFSNRTKRNYILDERVKGKVSIYLPGRVNADEAIRILDSVLALKGFTSVPIGDNLWKIIPSQEAKQTTIPTINEIDGRGSAMMVTKLINLRHIPAAEAQQLVAGLVSPFGLVNAYAGANSLIVIDSEENIQRIVQLIESLDIPFTDQDMTLIPIEHADAADVADKIKQILLDEKANNGQGGGMPIDVRARLGGNNAGQQTEGISNLQGSSQNIAARAREPKIISDERTNSLIIVADDSTTARIRALVSELDSPVNLSGNRFYVYRCLHATAGDLADVLSGLVGGGSGGSSNKSSTGSSSFGGGSDTSDGTPLSDRTARTQSRLARQQRTPGQSRSNNASSNNGTTVQFAEDFSITADTSTNSLIINANKSDYEKVLELLKQIDIKRRQVIVEAMILEVEVTDRTLTGLEFSGSLGGSDGGLWAANNAGGLTQLLSNPTQLSQFSVAAASAGTLTLPGGISIPTQTVLLSALSSNSNVNVLSSPTILATDNQDAEIVVGQNVPFLASTSSSQDNLNNTFNQIDRQDVGITLRITPQINSDDYVTLRLFTEVSSLDLATTDSPLGPTTRVRTSETTVVTRDSQMIVIGGLISDSTSEDHRGVPYLKDIPVIGHAFKRTTVAAARNNLLIFIIPKIIKDQFDARDITKTRTAGLEQDIRNNELAPSRSDVLNSMDIDRVIDNNNFDGEQPGTIRPKVHADRPNEQLALNHANTSGPTYIPDQSGKYQPNNQVNKPAAVDPKPTNPNPKGQDLLQFDVEPELPMPLEAYDPRASIKSPKPVTQQQTDQQKSQELSQFIVFQALNPNSAAKSVLPINRGNLVAVALPGQTNSTIKSFFVSGQNYEFSNAGKQVRLRALGVFDKAQEAGQFYQELRDAQWYSLTPHEMFNLGKGPWRQIK